MSRLLSQGSDRLAAQCKLATSFGRRSDLQPESPMHIRQLQWIEPVTAMRSLADRPYLTFLDSAAKHSSLGRYSYVACDPGCVKTFFLPQKLHATGDYPRRHDGLSIFFFVESRVNPGASSGHAERPERSHDAHNNTSSSRPDCHQERLDADDVHDAREVVGEYVQRHFGRDIGQPLH